MEPEIIKMLFTLGTYGPLGVMAVVGFLLFLQERKRSVELNTKIGEYIKVSLVADAEHAKAMSGLSNLYDLASKFIEVSATGNASMLALKESIENLEEEVRRSYESKRR